MQQPSPSSESQQDVGQPQFTTVLSKRSASALKPVVSYFELFGQSLQDMFEVTTNPDGYVVLAVAENKLAWPLLAPLFNSCAQGFPDELSGYNDMKGNQPFRDALAAHMTRKFGGYNFASEHFIVLAGCGAVIDMLAYCFCDDGECIMLPTPYYPGFDNDLRVKANVEIVVSETEAPHHRLTLDGLRNTFETAKANGKVVKALLITNPHNPLGTCIQREELEAAIDFANEVGIHLISDEIYAESVYMEDADFISVAQICKERGTKCADNIHVVYGFSKDFAASGLRVGLVYSENQILHSAAVNLSYFCSVSGQTQHTLTKVLQQEEALDDYFDRTRKQLASQYKNLTSRLKEMHIPFIPSAAGLFTCIDLRSCLDEPTWEAEARLHRKLFDECKILLTPGADCRMPEPGWFRCCWAWVSEDAVNTFARRFKQTFLPNTDAEKKQ